MFFRAQVRLRQGTTETRHARNWPVINGGVVRYLVRWDFRPNLDRPSTPAESSRLTSRCSFGLFPCSWAADSCWANYPGATALHHNPGAYHQSWNAIWTRAPCLNQWVLNRKKIPRKRSSFRFTINWWVWTKYWGMKVSSLTNCVRVTARCHWSWETSPSSICHKAYAWKNSDLEATLASHRHTSPRHQSFRALASNLAGAFSFSFKAKANKLGGLAFNEFFEGLSSYK